MLVSDSPHPFPPVNPFEGLHLHRLVLLGVGILGREGMSLLKISITDLSFRICYKARVLKDIASLHRRSTGKLLSDAEYRHYIIVRPNHSPLGAPEPTVTFSRPAWEADESWHLIELVVLRRAQQRILLSGFRLR